MAFSLLKTADHGFDEPLALLSDCHRRIERFMSVLRSVFHQAGGRSLNDEERRVAEAALTYFRTAAPRHTADEEESLFPLLRASGQPPARDAMQTVERLESDHEAADANHAQVDRLYRLWIDRGSLDENERRDLGRALGALSEMYKQHIEVEDREIFPLAGRLLSLEQLAGVGKEMAARRGLGSVQKEVPAMNTQNTIDVTGKAEAAGGPSEA